MSDYRERAEAFVELLHVDWFSDGPDETATRLAAEFAAAARLRQIAGGSGQ